MCSDFSSEEPGLLQPARSRGHRRSHGVRRRVSPGGVIYCQDDKSGETINRTRRLSATNKQHLPSTILKLTKVLPRTIFGLVHHQVGAKVLLLKNLDSSNQLVNGATGVVTEFVDASGRRLPRVEFDAMEGSGKVVTVIREEEWTVSSGGR